jgi:hypothetical protein
VIINTSSNGSINSSSTEKTPKPLRYNPLKMAAYASGSGSNSIENT